MFMGRLYQKKTHGLYKGNTFEHSYIGLRKDKYFFTKAVCEMFVNRHTIAYKVIQRSNIKRSKIDTEGNVEDESDNDQDEDIVERSGNESKRVLPSTGNIIFVHLIFDYLTLDYLTI